jgi:hypothetical protein
VEHGQPNVAHDSDPSTAAINLPPRRLPLQHRSPPRSEHLLHNPILLRVNPSSFWVTTAIGDGERYQLRFSFQEWSAAATRWWRWTVYAAIQGRPCWRGSCNCTAPPWSSPWYGLCS